MNLGLLGLERLSAGEIALIVIALLLIFGAKRIPEIARALGRSIQEFKKGQQDGAAGQNDRSEGKTNSDNPSH